MTLDQLRYFLAVCKYDSVSRAAEVLNISQPSVSNAVSNLAKELGVSLFSRQRKRLVLTQEGQLLVTMAEKLLSQAEDISRTMEALGKKNHVLRLGVPPMIGSLVLPALYSDYFSQHPSVHVKIVEDDSSGLKRLLEEGEIDMAFLPHTGNFDGNFGSELLTELQNVCCVHKSHPLAKKKSLCLAELSQEPLVLFRNSFFQTERILEGFSRINCTPKILLDTAQLSTVQNMIAGGSAVGFLFAPLLDTAGQLVGIPLQPPMTTRVSLVWRADRHMRDEMAALAQFVKDDLAVKFKNI